MPRRCIIDAMMFKRPRKVTVVGSGTMGHAIAQVAAMSGYQVDMTDTKAEYIQKGMDNIGKSLTRFAEKGSISEADAKAAMTRVRGTTDIGDALHGSDIMIEAVFETIEAKREVYEKASLAADKYTIFATNTSTLPIGEVAALTNRPEMVIGLHFFNPVQIMKLVEVIPGRQTHDGLAGYAMDFARTLSKEPILCEKDVPGFIVNRMFIPMVHEAMWSLDRTSASMESVDSALKFRLGFPMGAFALADYTGIDIVHHATESMASRDAASVNPHSIIKKLFDEHTLGIKTGSGFYNYANGMQPYIAQELADRFDPIEVLAPPLNSAAWLISNKVSDRQEIEKALLLGMGVKKPLFESARDVGIDDILEKLNSLRENNPVFYRADPLIESLRT